MLRSAFFKYSFFILLFVDISYTIALNIAGMAFFDVKGVLTSLTWFVTFFWLPVWATAIVILSLRSKGVNNTVVEWSIAVVAMVVGNTVTDQILPLIYSHYKGMGWFVIFNGMIWASPIYFITRYIENRKNINEEKSARKQAQLATLRYQLNPHFMFNSLNTISAYIHTKPDLADEVLHELADILRYSLDTAEKQSIALQQEVNIIEKYLTIEQARFGDRLTINYNIPQALTNILVPPLILQPIIENSVKHNHTQKALNLFLSIKEIDHQRIRIIITDNGKGFSASVLKQGHGKGIGMKNLQQRIHQLPKGKVRLSNHIPNKEQQHTGAIVTLEMAK